jgi:hypothetical protein
VRSGDVLAYVLKLRAQFFAVGADAVGPVQHQLKEGKDGRLGLEILRDVGVVPTKRELHGIFYKDEKERALLERILKETDWGK